jgi:cytochrome c-type biogenesis protein
MDIALFAGAFVAGMLMFLAPCTLPVVPGYLAFIAGIPLSALTNPAAKASARKVVFKNALAFVIGFSLIFILLGASAGLLGAFIGPWRYALAKLGGVVIIIFGLTMLGAVSIPLLSKEKHLRLPSFLTLGRLPSSALIGAFFALGWSPCIGPLLGTILLIASNSATAWYGAALLGVFSVGLAVPFLLTALLVTESTVFLSRIGGALRWLSIIGGLGLIFGGVLILTDTSSVIVAWFYELFYATGYGALLKYF